MLSSVARSSASSRVAMVGLALAGIATGTVPTVWNHAVQAQETKRTVQANTLTSDAERIGSHVAAMPNPAREPIKLRGLVMANDRVQLAAGRSGVLVSVVREGSKVKAGDRLAGLSEDPLRIARLDVEEAQATLEIETALEADELRQAGSNPRIRRLAVTRAKIQLERAQAQMEQMLQALSLTAPFDGTVTRVYKAKGETVQLGEPVVDVVNTKRLTVDGRVDSNTSLPELDAPVSVLMRVEGKLRTYTGRIEFVDEALDVASQTYRVRAEVATEHHQLRPGLRVEMIIYPRPGDLIDQEGEDRIN